MPSGGKKKRGEEKKKARELQALLHEGMVLSENGNEREAADKLMEAVLAAPDVWTKHRFVAFGSHTDCIARKQGATRSR